MAQRLSDSDVSPAVATKIAARASRADEAVVVGNRAGIIEWANAAWTKVTGFPVDDALHKPIGWLLDAAEIEADVVDFVQRHFLSGLRCEVELPVTTPDGRDLWIHLDVEPFRDEQGEIADFVAVATDITARRNGERALEDRIARALADTREHDTTTIVSEARVDLAPLEQRVALARIVDAVEAALARGTQSDPFEALEAIRGFARAGLEGEAEPRDRADVDLAGLCRNACVRIAQGLPYTTAVDADLAEGLPTAHVDADAAARLLDELLADGARAIGDEWGTLSVSTGITEPGRALASAVHPSIDRTPLEQGRAYLFVEVHDTAMSLPRDVLSAIHESQGGCPAHARGLALQLAAARAEALGGALRVHSLPGVGTRVVVYLPL